MPDRLRVLMLNFEFPPIGGGAANANYHLLREFEKRDDLEIDLVTSSPTDAYQEVRFSPNTRIFRLNVKKRCLHYWRAIEIARWTWKAYWQCCQLLETRSYDLAHCWFGWPAGVVGHLLRRRLPTLVALRGSDVPGYNERLGFLDRTLFKHISRVVWRQARVVTANSRNLRRLAERTCSDRPIEIIYNGVVSSAAPPAKKRSDCNLLFAGRLIKRKGVASLLMALEKLVAEHVWSRAPYRLTIAGDGPERTRLERLVSEANLESYVSFVGAVDDVYLKKLYREAHVFVVPSQAESLSNVVLEAMAAGLPVITTDTGVAEILDGNGMVVATDDAAQIAEAVKCYVGDPDLRDEHGRRSREIAEMFSWRDTAEAYVRLYERIVPSVNLPAVTC